MSKLPISVAEKREKRALLREQLTVSLTDYQQAVEHLMRLANQDTSGSRAAAQVLLSLYNGYEWHMDLTDLCCLDSHYFYNALMAIRGRVLLSKEPHSVIAEGEKRFLNLWHFWASTLHNSNRYADFYLSTK